MKKFFYCILPFIVIWGGYFSLLCIPQLHHEYLGTVEGNDIVISTSEHQSGNDYYNLYTCKFKYKDVIGVTRSSDDIYTNITFRYIPSKGFVTRSNKAWEIKQLVKHGKVYAPGWSFWSIIVLVSGVFILVPYFFLHCTGQFECISRGLNYECGNISDYCFGCPFCVTDKRTNLNIKKHILKPMTKTKNFFGY